ncbi:MAG TPA: hypothetical protein VF265_03945 [Nevskiaceae bacterium]
MAHIVGSVCTSHVAAIDRALDAAPVTEVHSNYHVLISNTATGLQALRPAAQWALPRAA